MKKTKKCGRCTKDYIEYGRGKLCYECWTESHRTKWKNKKEI